MSVPRATLAIDPRLFGRRRRGASQSAVPRPILAADVKLFATTFVGGFLFMAIFLA